MYKGRISDEKISLIRTAIKEHPGITVMGISKATDIDYYTVKGALRYLPVWDKPSGGLVLVDLDEPECRLQHDWENRRRGPLISSKVHLLGAYNG